jgi:predicted secreted protein
MVNQFASCLAHHLSVWYRWYFLLEFLPFCKRLIREENHRAGTTHADAKSDDDGMRLFFIASLTEYGSLNLRDVSS